MLGVTGRVCPKHRTACVFPICLSVHWLKLHTPCITSSQAKYYATMVNGVAITYTPSAAASSLDTDFASRARSAWTALRYETPTLASRVTRVDGGSGALDYKLCYTAPTQAEEVEAWARATLVHVPTPQTMQDLLYALNSQEVLDKVRPDERNYAANMYYCQGPNRGEYNICFVNCHSVLDARGYFRVSGMIGAVYPGKGRR